MEHLAVPLKSSFYWEIIQTSHKFNVKTGFNNLMDVPLLTALGRVIQTKLWCQQAKQ